MNAEPSAGATRILAGLLETRTGQQLSPARSWRIEASLKPVLRELEISTLDQLVAKLVEPGGSALTAKVTEALLNNETSFFRDKTAFDQLDRDALQMLRGNRERTRHLRIWSAACSTGQEVYSLAMLLRDGGPRWTGWTFDILATDVSSSAVARAKEGRFSRFEIQRGLPVRTMLRWFREDGETWVADATLRRDLRFATHNLGDPAPGQFDMILCRNVLMYFTLARRAQVFDRLAEALSPGGVLMLGAGETVIGQTERFASHPGMRGLYIAMNDVSRSPLRVACR